MNLINKALVAGVMMTTMMTASAAVIETLVGDIDGFGGQTTPGAVGVGTSFNFNNASATDPAFTDRWLFEQNVGAGESPINFSFSYTLSGATATSATLSLMESGMSDGRGPWNVLFNGNLAGSIANGLASTSTLHNFAIDVSWLTGSIDQVSLVYMDSQFEGFAIDYSALAIQTTQTAQVPLPGILPLVGIGALALAALRRRKVRYA